MKRVLFFLLLSGWKNKQAWSRGRQLTSWYPSLPPCLTGLTPHTRIPGKQGPGSRDAHRSMEGWAACQGHCRGQRQVQLRARVRVCVHRRPTYCPFWILNHPQKAGGFSSCYRWGGWNQGRTCDSHSLDWCASLAPSTQAESTGTCLMAGARGESWAGWIGGWVSCCLPGLSLQTKGGEADQTGRISEAPTLSVPQGQDLPWERAVAAILSSQVLRGTHHWPGPLGPGGHTGRAAPLPWRLGTEGGKWFSG